MPIKGTNNKFDDPIFLGVLEHIENAKKNQRSKNKKSTESVKPTTVDKKKKK